MHGSYTLVVTIIFGKNEAQFNTITLPGFENSSGAELAFNDIKQKYPHANFIHAIVGVNTY